MDNEFLKEEDAIAIGARFTQELRDLGGKYQLNISPASAARFYADNLQSMILRQLHDSIKKGKREP